MVSKASRVTKELGFKAHKEDKESKAHKVYKDSRGQEFRGIKD
jgi:hypothetical protein